MLALRAHEKILGKAEKVFNDQLGLVDFLTLTLKQIKINYVACQGGDGGFKFSVHYFLFVGRG